PDNDGVTNVLAGSTIALLIMLALWVGGLVTYTVLKPIPASTLLSTRSSFAVWLRGLVPGAVVGLLQALVLSILAVTVMDIDAGQGFDIAVLTFVSALVFMILNFALVAWFGGVGRFLSVIAVVLAVAGRTIGAVPGFFDFVAPILPLPPAMNGFAAIAAGTPGQAAAYGGLLAWAVLGVGLPRVASDRAGTTTPEAALAMAWRPGGGAGRRRLCPRARSTTDSFGCAPSSLSQIGLSAKGAVAQRRSRIASA